MKNGHTIIGFSRLSLPVLFAAGLMSAALFSGAAFAAEEKPYVCPMSEHADVAADKPGPCPKCGMDLVPRAKSHSSGGQASSCTASAEACGAGSSVKETDRHQGGDYHAQHGDRAGHGEHAGH